MTDLNSWLLGPAEEETSALDRTARLLSGNGESFKGAVARLRQEHPELAHLDDDQAMALRRYVGEDANTLNHTLRHGDQLDRNYLAPDAKVLRSALEDTPRVDTTETPQVFRSIGLNDEDLAGLLERYKPGEIVEEPGFTSASKDLPPDLYADRGDKANHVRFVIDHPRTAREVETLNPTEREVVFPDQNRFEATDVEAVSKGEWIIHMLDRGGT